MVERRDGSRCELAGDPPEAAGAAAPRRINGSGADSPRRETTSERPGRPRATRRRSPPSSGRPPRGIHEIAHRCPCGNPDVVTTEPRLPDGTPFPTTFYLTCPRAASRIGTLEGSGLMKEMEARLGERPRAGGGVRRGARALPRGPRRARATCPRSRAISAGGMPDRVKCLHVLAGQALAQGRGVNPLGDEVLDALGEWWASGPCVEVARRARWS